MRVGLDLDGVFCDFNTAFIELIAGQTGKQLPPVSDTFPDIWSYHKRVVTSAEDQRLWEWIKGSGFWATLNPLPGALATLKRINTWAFVGHQFYFITTRPGTHAKLLSERWLMTYGITAPTVLIAENEASKGLLAKALGLDLFIDDKPSNCEAVVEETMSFETIAAVDGWSSEAPVYECRVCLFDAPYNRDATPPGVERITDVEAILAEVLNGEVARAA